MPRPTKFKPEYVDLARKFCILGATNETLADFFNVAGSTVDKWIKENPEFSGAIKEGRQIADANVGQALYERAIGYSHPEEKIFNNKGLIIRANTTRHYPPDPTAMIFWLKNRRPDLWRDRFEHTGADGGPVEMLLIEKLPTSGKGVK